ncbi:MAG TPA: DUF1049 domain-containing protein [Rubrivivax sp.]|nr:DUF1049 domain-containing protein [Rubrivivax sp.]
MRFVHLAIIVVLSLIVLTFKLQNLQSVTLQFLGMSMTLPVTLLLVLVYVLGMFTGASLWSLLKKSYAGSRAQP